MRKYNTPAGKTVYGGGGIMPDIFIPLERGISYKFYNISISKGILYQFAFDYTDQHRSALRKFKDVQAFDRIFAVTPSLYNEYVGYAGKNGIGSTFPEISSSSQLISELLKAYIARNLFDDKGFYPIFLKTDKGFEKAIQELTK
jgi:carboxyl-terminal processing protease